MMLRSEQLRSELEVTEDQWEDLEGLQQDMMQDMRGMWQEMRDMDEEERADFMKEITEDIEAEISDILLPHQTKRLKQISLQQSMRGGTAGLLRNQAVIEELGLSDADIEKLQEKSEEVQAEMNEKIAKMRKQAQDEVFSVLSKEQREKLEEMLGDPYEMQFGRGGPQAGGRQGGGRWRRTARSWWRWRIASTNRPRQGPASAVRLAATQMLPANTPGKPRILSHTGQIPARFFFGTVTPRNNRRACGFNFSVEPQNPASDRSGSRFASRPVCNPPLPPSNADAMRTRNSNIQRNCFDPVDCRIQIFSFNRPCPAPRAEFALEFPRWHGPGQFMLGCVPGLARSIRCRL